MPIKTVTLSPEQRAKYDSINTAIQQARKSEQQWQQTFYAFTADTFNCSIDEFGTRTGSDQKIAVLSDDGQALHLLNFDEFLATRKGR